MTEETQASSNESSPEEYDYETLNKYLSENTYDSLENEIIAWEIAKFITAYTDEIHKTDKELISFTLKVAKDCIETLKLNSPAKSAISWEMTKYLLNYIDWPQEDYEFKYFVLNLIYQCSRSLTPSSTPQPDWGNRKKS